MNEPKLTILQGGFCRLYPDGRVETCNEYDGPLADFRGSYTRPARMFPSLDAYLKSTEGRCFGRIGRR